MIEMFKDNEIRSSGLIFSSVLEQIKELHQYDPDQAGELAISAIELVLTGDISSDDVNVKIMLAPLRKINEVNVAKKWVEWFWNRNIKEGSRNRRND